MRIIDGLIKFFSIEVIYAIAGAAIFSLVALFLASELHWLVATIFGLTVAAIVVFQKKTRWPVRLIMIVMSVWVIWFDRESFSGYWDLFWSAFLQLVFLLTPNKK